MVKPQNNINRKQRRVGLENQIRGITLKQIKQQKLRQKKQEEESSESSYQGPLTVDQDLEQLLQMDSKDYKKVQQLSNRMMQYEVNSVSGKKITAQTNQKTQDIFVNIDDVTENEDNLLDLFTDVSVVKESENDLLVQQMQQPNNSVNDLLAQFKLVFNQVAPLLQKYKSGALPKILKFVPASNLWFQILEFTIPERWSPNATYKLTALFIAQLPEDQAYIFLSRILVPKCVEDIKKNRKLNVHYFNALIKSRYKCYAFFKALPLYVAQYNTVANFTKCVNAVMQHISLPRPVVISGIRQILQIEPNSAIYALIGNFVTKNYSLPREIVEDLITLYERTSNQRQPLVWHESLLRFVQKYGASMTGDEQVRVYQITKACVHSGGITEEIQRVLKEVSQTSGLRGVAIPYNPNDIII